MGSSGGSGFEVGPVSGALSIGFAGAVILRMVMAVSTKSGSVDSVSRERNVSLDAISTMHKR